MTIHSGVKYLALLILATAVYNLAMRPLSPLLAS